MIIVIHCINSKMRKIFWIPFILFLAAPVAIDAQAPDLSKIKNDKDKIKAWVDYCNVLRLNKNGAKDNYVVLQQAGLKGLQMVQPGDKENKASFYLFTALGYYYQIKFDSAQYYFYQSLHSAQQARSTKLIAGAAEALMSINFQLQQLDKVDECKNILQSIADTSKNTAILQDIYSAFGSYYQQRSYYSTAQDYYIKSIQLREKEVDTATNPKTKFDYAIQCDQLSKLYLNTDMADKSLAALRQGERFADISPVVSNRLLSSFVEAFTTSGNIDSALYYNTQLEIHTKNQSIFPSEIVSSNLNIAIYYINHRQYAAAFPYINKGDSLATIIKSPFLIFQAQMIRGHYLEETGKPDEAINLLTQALPVAQQLNKELQSEIIKYIAASWKQKGDAKASLGYYEQYVQLQDTLTKEKISRTFADLETHYQTNEKEIRIASLDQKNKLDALELKEASNTMNLLILGLVSLGIFSLLLYFIYRNKERLNKILNIRNQQLDELNRDLSIANDTKARLFGVISHDLRTPVSRIVQLLHLQKESPAYLNDDTRLLYQARVNKASENVLETMEDLLLWSKSQMNNFTPENRLISIAPLLLREMDLFEEQITEKELAVDMQVSPGIAQNTDENFMGVIIRNLLQNAISQCQRNAAISLAADEHTISITNPSGGTSATELNSVIQQAEVNSKRTGLGLQIAKDLASRLGIRIFYEQRDKNSITAVVSWI
jgi:signal transduction histidine kinase